MLSIYNRVYVVDNFIILETVIFSRQLEKTTLWYKVRTSKLFEPKLALCMYGGTQIVTLPAEFQATISPPVNGSILAQFYMIT